jgi:hypothetical protein
LVGRWLLGVVATSGIGIRSGILNRLLRNLLLLLLRVLPVVRGSGGLLLLLVVLLLLVLLLLHLLLLAHAFHVFRHLRDHAHLLLPHHLEVSVLGSLNLTINSVDFKLIGVNLTLVVLEFSNHLLKLLGALLQVLLVNDELLGDFGTTLFGQNILKLDVKLLLFLDKDILLRDLFSLRNKSLLEGLDLLNELVGLDVSGLKLSPSVDIEGLAELILEEFSFLLLLK